MDAHVIRTPEAGDGYALNRLVSRCPPLDRNSIYANLLQVSHFRNTGAVAVAAGRLAGFVTGYRVPDRPDTLFVWQVGVDPADRGAGLAGRMVDHILARPFNADISFIETTITSDNAASWTLFRRVAERLGCPMESSEHFLWDKHFNNEHDSEFLVRIGAFGYAPRERFEANSAGPGRIGKMAKVWR